MSKRKVVYRKGKRSRRHTTHEAGVIETTLGSIAAMLPFVSDKTSTGESVLQDIMNNIQAYQNGWGTDFNSLGKELESATMNNLLDIIELIITAGVLSWVGKKSGMRAKTKVSKKWSLI